MLYSNNHNNPQEINLNLQIYDVFSFLLLWSIASLFSYDCTCGWNDTLVLVIVLSEFVLIDICIPEASEISYTSLIDTKKKEFEVPAIHVGLKFPFKRSFLSFAVLLVIAANDV